MSLMGDGSGTFDLTIVTTNGVTQYALVPKSAAANKRLAPPPVQPHPFPAQTQAQLVSWTQKYSITSTSLSLSGPFGIGWVAYPAVNPGYPTAPTPYPTFVIVPGGPLSEQQQYASYSSLANNIAGSGGLAFIAEYRSDTAYGGGWPVTMQDVAGCVEMARTAAPTYGGTTKVTRVAHSFGGYSGSVVSLGGLPNITAAQTPDAYVAVCAISSAAGVGFAGGDFNGTPDPLTLTSNRPGFPVGVVRGSADNVALSDNKDAFSAGLAAGNHPGVNLLVMGGDHTSTLYSQNAIDAMFAMAKMA